MVQGRTMFNWQCVYQLLYFLLFCGCWNEYCEPHIKLCWCFTKYSLSSL